jgi:hypothetical protein
MGEMPLSEVLLMRVGERKKGRLEEVEEVEEVEEGEEGEERKKRKRIVGGGGG